MRHGQTRFIVGFLVLPLALYAVFVISPFIQAFYYSLTNWTGVSPQFDFIGLTNFQNLLQDSLFLRAVRNNAVLLVVMPLAVILLALFYAFLLNVGGGGAGTGVRGVRGSGFYKLAFFLPQVLSVPVIAVIWIWLGRRNAEPNIPRKFSLGLIFNGLAFLLLMFALSSLVNEAGKIPFWTLFMVYVIQSIGELCLSPIGLSMVTKLAPVRLVGFGMGGWFLSTGIGNNFSGIFAGHVSGETGMTTTSALTGYTFGFWALVGAGVLLFLIAPLIQKLMHGVR